MDEIKALLKAVIENQAVTNAKLDAIEMRLAKNEGNVIEILSQLDYLAGKLGQHDRDLYVMKQRNG